MNLSIKHLRAFLILSESDSFTNASRRFNLSQPAFSSLIAALEEDIGYRLFDRDTRRVNLNNNGIHFLEIARKLIKSHDDAISEVRARGEGRIGNVTLAVLPSLAVQWLPDILSKYNNASPETKIKLIDTQWNACLQALLDGQADIALLAGQPPENLFDSTLLFSDKFYVLSHSQHPLAKFSSIELSDLQNYPFIGFSSCTSIRQYTDRISEKLDIGLNYQLEVRELTTMMGLISANYGISITTGLTLFQFEHQNITILPIRDLFLERAIYLVTPKGKSIPSHVQKFSQFIAEQAKSFEPERVKV
ncbi:LysR family transcriptional regulator [Photobacterium makurazakiensis]|uniref:LysR family transcriptional regulator n=1 Tax=Photobacterium makurazakiensis TaxID=2910234 RepID=UPI003D12EFF9